MPSSPPSTSCRLWRPVVSAGQRGQLSPCTLQGARPVSSPRRPEHSYLAPAPKEKHLGPRSLPGGRGCPWGRGQFSTLSSLPRTGHGHQVSPSSPALDKVGGRCPGGQDNNDLRGHPAGMKGDRRIRVKGDEGLWRRHLVYHSDTTACLRCTTRCRWAPYLSSPLPLPQ